MRIHLGADHAGLEAKNAVVDHLRGLGHDVVDHGPFAYDALDDYPVFCLRAAEAVVDEPGSLGVVLGGSGNGEQIAANKVPGVRAALAWNPTLAVLAREHNDANVVGIGGRMHSLDEVCAIAAAFVDTPFSNDDRHIRRITMISEYETDGVLPPLA